MTEEWHDDPLQVALFFLGAGFFFGMLFGVVFAEPLRIILPFDVIAEGVKAMLEAFL